jgi:hypothetical protein
LSVPIPFINKETILSDSPQSASIGTTASSDAILQEKSNNIVS